MICYKCSHAMESVRPIFDNDAVYTEYHCNNCGETIFEFEYQLDVDKEPDYILDEDWE